MVLEQVDALLLGVLVVVDTVKAGVVPNEVAVLALQSHDRFFPQGMCMYYVYARTVQVASLMIRISLFVVQNAAFHRDTAISRHF